MVSRAIAAALNFGAVDSIMAEVSLPSHSLTLTASSFLLQYKFSAQVVTLGALQIHNDVSIYPICVNVCFSGLFSGLLL